MIQVDKFLLKFDTVYTKLLCIYLVSFFPLVGGRKSFNTSKLFVLCQCHFFSMTVSKHVDKTLHKSLYGIYIENLCLQKRCIVTADEVNFSIWHMKSK